MKDLLKHFSLLDRLNTVFLGIIIVIWFFSIPYSPYSYEPLLVFILTAATIWLSVYFRKENKTLGFAKAFRLAYPLIYLFVIFESFFMILPFINPYRYDELLTNMVFAMFGVHPRVWNE
jgi:hypothetical protein